MPSAVSDWQARLAERGAAEREPRAERAFKTYTLAVSLGILIESISRIGNFYRFYFRNILPRVGGLISGDASAYTYLPRSVSRFFRPTELAALMGRVGYASPKFEVWTFGTVALHTGIKSRN